MDRVKIIKRFDRPLRFSVSALEKDARLFFSLVDSTVHDVLFHVEFDKAEGVLSVKERYSGVWSKPEKHEFPFKGQTIKGKLSLEGESFVLELKDFRLEFPCKAQNKPLFWSLYSDFRYLTLGDDEPVAQAQARRWRFFPTHRLRLGEGPRLRALSEGEALKPGLSGLYLWDGDEAAFGRLIEKIHPLVDELVVVVHNSSLYRNGFFVGLQSRHFNLRTVIVETAIKSDGALRKLKGALFVNRVLTEIRHRTVVFLDSATDPERLATLVNDRRLRSRTDDFLVLDEARPERLQAFSVGRPTHFVEAEGRLRLAPEDLAIRHALSAPAVAPAASLEWDVGETRIPDFPVTMHDRRKTVRLPKRGKLAVLVVSCRRNRHKQQAIRDTWAADARLANIDLVFLEGHPGQPAPALVEDRLILPVADTYEYLSHKIWHGVSAALALLDAGHFLKLDDDCVLNVQKLLEFAYEDFDYAGSDVNLGGRTALDWHGPAVFNKQLAGLIFEMDPEQTWFDGQGGYFLSRKAAKILAATPLAQYQHMLEDYATGRLMAAHGLEALSLNSKFLSIREIHIKEDRDYDKAVISDVTSVERTFEIYETVSKLNQQVLDSKGRWRFEFPPEGAK